jgi:hypothetical protein
MGKTKDQEVNKKKKRLFGNANEKRDFLSRFVKSTQKRTRNAFKVGPTRNRVNRLTVRVFRFLFLFIRQ